MLPLLRETSPQPMLFCIHARKGMSNTTVAGRCVHLNVPHRIDYLTVHSVYSLTASSRSNRPNYAPSFAFISPIEMRRDTAMLTCPILHYRRLVSHISPNRFPYISNSRLSIPIATPTLSYCFTFLVACMSETVGIAKVPSKRSVTT